ncbi:hypothetical protein ACFVVM_08465 [Nocardia sp. NPDC058176]|uniref:hypothetical protein n=1 Tax=Nocardia sp. NPDC058176 TaxID=3346368 RepID=UPI0036DC5E2C
MDGVREVRDATAVPITPRRVIEAFLPDSGVARLDLVYDTANAAGVADQPLRLALRRMVTTGEIVLTGRGRSGTARLTDIGRRRLERDRVGLRLAVAQDQGQAPWDRQWRMLAVSAPESDRATRDALRRRLTELGAVSVSTGLYLSPHDLGELLADLDPVHLVRATTGELNVRGVVDAHILTEQLWPAGPIIAGYTIVEQVLADVEEATASDHEMAVLVQQLRLAEALERAMRTDPLIPAELRDGPWPPSRTRRRWRRTWAALTERLPGDLLYRGWM